MHRHFLYIFIILFLYALNQLHLINIVSYHLLMPRLVSWVRFVLGAGKSSTNTDPQYNQSIFVKSWLARSHTLVGSPRASHIGVIVFLSGFYLIYLFMFILFLFDLFVFFIYFYFHFWCVPFVSVCVNILVGLFVVLFLIVLVQLLYVQSLCHCSRCCVRSIQWFLWNWGIP